ncbi:MAG: SCP2 sterol-binding domain-containing protein [Gammaproteobacteria bacterium]
MEPSPPRLFQPVANLLNQGIRGSRDARDRCQALEGATFRMQLEGLGLGFTLRSAGDRVAVTDETDADARLSGRPLALARLAATGDEALLRSKSVRIEGDPMVARDFQALIQLAAPDFEEALARLVGDVAARRLANLARGAATWGLDAADRLSRDVAEYLQEESGDLPTRHEVEQFLDQVDTLAADVERAGVRLRRLEQAR